MLPCIVIDFFLNNQADAIIIQIYSVIKLYMLRAYSLPIIRSSLLYIWHWQVSRRFLMTVSMQSQDGTAVQHEVLYRVLHEDVHLLFFLNNQPDALIIQIYSVIKLYMFQASSLPIIRSFPLYIRHW